MYSTPTSSRAAVQAGSSAGNMPAKPRSSGPFRRENWERLGLLLAGGRETMLDAESLHALTSILFQLSEGKWCARRGIGRDLILTRAKAWNKGGKGPCARSQNPDSSSFQLSCSCYHGENFFSFSFSFSFSSLGLWGVAKRRNFGTVVKDGPSFLIYIYIYIYKEEWYGLLTKKQRSGLDSSTAQVVRCCANGPTWVRTKMGMHQLILLETVRPAVHCMHAWASQSLCRPDFNLLGLYSSDL